MGRIGTIAHENYSPERLERIGLSIENAAKAGQPTEYEILIDGMKVIPRTSDPATFNTFSEFVNQSSECLVVYLFYGASRQHDKFFFYFKGIPGQKQSPHVLSDTDAEWNKAQKDRVLKEIHYEKLIEENRKLSDRLEDLEEDLQKKEAYWEKIRKGQAISFGEIASSGLVSLLNRPEIKKVLPGLSGIIDLFSPKNASYVEKEVKPEEEATFSRKSEGSKANETPQPELDEETLGFLQLLKDLATLLKPNELEYMKDIIRTLALNPAALKSTHKHIHNFIRWKPEPKNE